MGPSEFPRALSAPGKKQLSMLLPPPSQGAGSALMARHTRFESILRGMGSVLECPLTVKMRAGIHKKNWNAHKLVPKLREWGVSMVTVR